MLRKPAGQQVPGFEQEDDKASVATAERPAAATPAAETPVVDKAKAQAEATVAVASAAASSKAVAVRVERRKMRDFIGELQNRLPAVGFGEAPRLVAASGVFKDADKLNLGAWIEFTLLSWNFTYTIRTGDQSEAAKKFVKYSKDRQKFQDGSSVDVYVQMLKVTENFPNASVEEYVELIGLLDSSEKPALYADQNGIVVVSLSPDSVKTFQGCRRDTSVQYMLGKIEASEEPRLRIVTQARDAKGKDWTRMVVSHLADTPAA